MTDSLQLRSLLFLFALLPVFSCYAEEKPMLEPFIAGTHYEVLPAPVRTEDPNKIEVAEFFWYGCSHCYEFEPSVNAWSKKVAKDVNFVRVPVTFFGDSAVQHAKMYYTAKQLNKLDKLHESFFTAMHVGKQTLANKDEIGKLFLQQGVDMNTFKKTFDSFSTDSLTKLAQAKTNGSKITGTPEVVVNGKYRVSTRLAGSFPQMLKVVDFLIEKERKAKNKK